VLRTDSLNCAVIPTTVIERRISPVELATVRLSVAGYSDHIQQQQQQCRQRRRAISRLSPRDASVKRSVGDLTEKWINYNDNGWTVGSTDQRLAGPA